MTQGGIVYYKDNVLEPNEQATDDKLAGTIYPESEVVTWFKEAGFEVEVPLEKMKTWGNYYTKHGIFMRMDD